MYQFKTMRSRLVRIMLVISGLTGIATFATVAMISVQTSTRHLATVQQHIEEGIASKGKVLTNNHALALRNLILDNAFTDIRLLVDRAVREDEDLVYGLFVGSERGTIALSRRDIGVGAEPSTEPPERDAWQGLGLTAENVLLERESVGRVQRLGQDLLEVAVPVVGDEGEKLGTIRYGLSTRRMHEALARAEADKSANLLSSVLWIGSLVSLTTFVGWLLSRMQAFRITRPVGELTQAAHDLASGNRSVRVNITSGDELQLLGTSFNHMVDELDVSYRELEEMNRTLEHKVGVRTLELASKNRDMRLVLDNVDQGFLTLSPDGSITGGRSRMVGEWFGDCPDGAAFAECIGQTSPTFGESFEFAWSQIVDGFLSLELAIDQLPTRLVAKGRTWKLRYLPFLEGEKLEGVLLVAAEITERLAREREEAEQRELMQSFTKLTLDRDGFLRFVREADKMVASICSRELDTHPVYLKRTLHTLKGNAAVMGLNLTASLCHAIEDQLEASGSVLDESLAQLSERWNRIHEHVLELVPPRSERALEVARSEYDALIARLSQDPAHAELLAPVLAWGLEPALRPLERLAEQATTLAARLGKGELQVVLQAGNVRLDPEHWQPFFSELVHVVRNAVDHGIEPPDERLRRGKPPGGRLLFSVQAIDDVLTFEIRDDGPGIDWDLIRAKAEERGLPHSTPDELVAVLCLDGVSTRREVTDSSGRGVGMAAFNQYVKGMRGHIEVKSSPEGSSWLIRFPARTAGTSSGRASSVPGPRVRLAAL